MKATLPPSLHKLILTLGCCLLFVVIIRQTVNVYAQQECIPPDSQPAESTECTIPPKLPTANAWAQNASVSVVVNANQYSKDEFDCIKAVFDNYNAKATANGSRVSFNVSYSTTAVAVLNSPYESGGPNSARNASGVTNGFQVNRATNMRPQAMGEEYIWDRWHKAEQLSCSPKFKYN
jgi:hypothetical protein